MTAPAQGELMFVLPIQLNNVLQPVLVRSGDTAEAIAASWAQRHGMATRDAALVADQVCRRVGVYCAAAGFV